MDFGVISTLNATQLLYIYVHIYDLYKVNYKKESKTIEHV